MPTRLRPALLALLFLLAIFGTTSTAIAQSLFLPGAEAPASGSDLSTVINEAAERGVALVVVDAQGNVISSLTSAQDGNAEAAAAVSAAARSGGGLMRAQEQASLFRDALIDRLADLPGAVNEVIYILRATSPDGTIFAFFKVLLISLLLFAVGMLAQRYIYGLHIAKHFVMPLIKEQPKGYSGKMPFLVVRFVAQVIGILFSIAVAYALGFAIYGPLEDSALQFTATVINIGYFSARFITGLWRMILSPFLSQYRIPYMTDADAKRLYFWLSGVVIAAVFALLFSYWIAELGLNEDVFIFISSLSGFIVMLLNVLMVLVNRRAITGAILHGRDVTSASWPLRMLARSWVPTVLVYLVFAWGESVYDRMLGLPEGFPLGPGAYLILTVVLVVYGVINFGIERSFARARALRLLNSQEEDAPLPDDDGDGLPDAVQDAVHMQRRQINTFEELARRVAGIIAFVAGAWAFLEFWEPGAAMMNESLASRALDIVVILFVGYIIYTAFRIWIDAKIREEQGDEEPAELGDEGGGSNASRLATLLPLFRNVTLIVIVLSVALIALMELGINVGPLFAGAGIVGVAIGFGSQTLVRDIFSGAFFLFDDAFRKGEYIEIGDVKGTVEKISVRSFQLRHHLGKLHTIPFGEIQVLSNYSRDWVMMKLPLRVTYDTDVEKVRKLIKKLGQQLLEDPEIGPDFIQPLKSQGVIEMQDSAMIIRVKFMTKPGDQWVIRKRVFQEIRDIFEREGIKFAHREVTVRLADDKAGDLTETRKNAVLAGAEAALDADDLLEDGGLSDDR